MANNNPILSILFKNKTDDDLLTVFKTFRADRNNLFEGDYNNVDDAVKSLKVFMKFGFSKKTISQIKGLGKRIREDLGLSDVEYLLLCPFIVRNKSIVSVDSITKMVFGNERTAFHIYKHLFTLFRKSILQVLPAEGDVFFVGSIFFQNYIISGKWEPDTKMWSLKQVIKTVDIIANMYNNFDHYSALGQAEILNILEMHKEYDFCKELLDMYSDSNENTPYYQFVFYVLGHMILNQPQLDRNCDLIESFCKFDKNREFIIDDIFIHDNHPVFKRKVFDRAIDDGGKADKNMIEIHADFKRKYLQGIVKEKRHESIITSENIVKKNLYFNDANQKQIDDLTTMLQRDQFSKIRERLQLSGVRTGFACLFSGMPGSGKTEVSLQIAKETGRDLVKVDMASLRSKWWGEDEKNVKAIFSNYKSILQDSRIEPILLLNEADAIIGKRLDVSGNNGAIISSINATQNIILEELETFEGILIATTNLTQNMDAAFERRFLYKIEFEMPSLENRAKIWMEFLKVDEKDATELARQFSFTGAQIENVFRKNTANSILYGDEYDFEKIVELCKQEKIERELKIGFGN
jgi:hypothetical protein